MAVRLKFVAAAALMIFLLVGCQPFTVRTGQYVDDATITASVRSRLVADQATSLTRVDVDTATGIVSLHGVVESADQKVRAEHLAGQVDGVRSVVNNLQIQTERRIEVRVLE